MIQLRTIQDPLGNTIVFPLTLASCSDNRSYYEVKQVVTEPAFVIQVGKTNLHFFRMLDWELNLLVSAKAKESYYVVEDCTENPDVAHISSLLEKGHLISFL